MSKRLLIVGDGNHQFIYNLVKWLKQEGSFSRIDILTNKSIRPDYVGIYDKIYSLESDSYLDKLLRKIYFVRYLYKKIRYKVLVMKLPEFEKVHFHFIGGDNLFLPKYFKNSKIIFSIWGSDLYRVESNKLPKLLAICRFAAIITFTNLETLEYFRKKLNWHKDNLEICRFGLAPLEVLKNLEESKHESKLKLNWDTKKVAITIGYNLSRGQQHIKIIQEISKISILKNKIILILPITYGFDNVYKLLLMSVLIESGIEFQVYDEYLNDFEVARIRNASDVMIQLQVTDQFSGSMQEHLYAENIVITGSWLPYNTLIERGVMFITIQDFNDLAPTVHEIVSNLENYKYSISKNPELIYAISSWKNNYQSWLKLYD